MTTDQKLAARDATTYLNQACVNINAFVSLRRNSGIVQPIALIPTLQSLQALQNEWQCFCGTHRVYDD